MVNKEHISKDLMRISKKYAHVLQMGGFVEEQIERAIEALVDGNESIIDQAVDHLRQRHGSINR